MFEDEQPINCLLRLKELHLIEIFHPSLPKYFNETFLLCISKAIKEYSDLMLNEQINVYRIFFLVVASWFEEKKELDELFDRLNLNDLKKHFLELLEKGQLALRSIQSSNGKRSTIYTILKPLHIDSIIYALGFNYFKNLSFEPFIKLFLTDLQFQKLQINGSDLKELGYKPGPQFARILNIILEAKLDQLIDERKQSQLNLAAKLLSESSADEIENNSQKKQQSKKKK